MRKLQGLALVVVALLLAILPGVGAARIAANHNLVRVH